MQFARTTCHACASRHAGLSQPRCLGISDCVIRPQTRPRCSKPSVLCATIQMGSMSQSELAKSIFFRLMSPATRRFSPAPMFWKSFSLQFCQCSITQSSTSNWTQHRRVQCGEVFPTIPAEIHPHALVRLVAELTQSVPCLVAVWQTLLTT